VNEGMTHHNGQMKENIHHVLDCFVNTFTLLFEYFKRSLIVWSYILVQRSFISNCTLNFMYSKPSIITKCCLNVFLICYFYYLWKNVSMLSFETCGLKCYVTPKCNWSCWKLRKHITFGWIIQKINEIKGWIKNYHHNHLGSQNSPKVVITL
jgi:hypothetical protein